MSLAPSGDAEQNVIRTKGVTMWDRTIGWLSGSPLGIRAMTRMNVALALGLSVFACVLVSGTASRTEPQGDAWACASVLLMTLPVAWRRAYPLAAIATLAAGALFNAIVIGSYVRCGATLP